MERRFKRKILSTVCLFAGVHSLLCLQSITALQTYPRACAILSVPVQLPGINTEKYSNILMWISCYPQTPTRQTTDNLWLPTLPRTRRTKTRTAPEWLISLLATSAVRGRYLTLPCIIKLLSKNGRLHCYICVLCPYISLSLSPLSLKPFSCPSLSFWNSLTLSLSHFLPLSHPLCLFHSTFSKLFLSFSLLLSFLYLSSVCLSICLPLCLSYLYFPLSLSLFRLRLFPLSSACLFHS